MDPKQQANNKNDKPEPTEEQVKAANEVEQAKWESDFNEEDLAIPYSREEATKEKKEGSQEEQEEQEHEDDRSEAEEYDEEVSSASLVEDPGEFEPGDYSFEVTLKGGKTVKVTTPEEAEKLADDPENFETPKQLMDFINRQNKMVTKLERDKEKWEAQKEAFETQVKEQEDHTNKVISLVNQIKYLVDRGDMPAIPKEFEDADWSTDKAAQEDESVKEHLKLITYREKQNKQREKLGLPEMSMLEAFTDMQHQAGKQKQASEKKQAGEARKAAGARVAGVSASSQAPYVPKGIAVGNPNVFNRNQAVWED